MAIIEIENQIKPLLKWPGGKFDELQFIIPAMPEIIERYFEPFLGGGAVYFSIPQDKPAYVNDKSYDLINFYQMVACQNEDFFLTLAGFVEHWRNLEEIIDDSSANLLQKYADFRDYVIDERILSRELNNFVDTISVNIESDLDSFLNQDIPFYIRSLRTSIKQKMKRMRKLEQKKGVMPDSDILDNIEAATKASFYYYVRHLYNYSEKFGLSKGKQGAVFFFMRENAYGAMFRFNKQGHFNIPYGGIGYNRKNIELKIDNLKNPLLASRLQNTEFGNDDFESFMGKYQLDENDFIFLDPPYDTEFSSYDQNPFAQADQKRLADFLIDECPAKFMLVIKSTDFIVSLYKNQGLKIHYFDKKYMYTVKERNNRDVVHLLITNY